MKTDIGYIKSELSETSTDIKELTKAVNDLRVDVKSQNKN